MRRCLSAAVQLQHRLARLAKVFPRQGMLLQQTTGHARVPLVFVRLQLGQLKRIQLVQRLGQALGFSVRYFENSAARTMHTVVFMALADVRPVEHVHPAVRSVAQFHPSKPHVLGLHDILDMFADVTRARAMKRILIDAPAVQVKRHDTAAIFLRPIVTIVDDHAAVRVAAAGRIRGRGHALALQVAPVLVAGVPVVVIRRLRDQLVQVFVKMIAVHPLVSSPGNAMPKMADYGVDKKQLPMLVPVVSPRIGRALGDNIKCLGHRMITEDATVHLHPIRSRSTRLADVGGGQDSVTPIQPAVRSPAQTVDDVVPHAVAVEAVEHHLRFAVRYVVAIAIRDEQNARSRRHPYAAKAHLDAGDVRALVPKHLSPIEHAIAVCVLKNQDAILHPRVESQLRIGVSVALGHPQPATAVPRHRDRLLHLRLSRAQLNRESLRHRDSFQGVRGTREWRGQFLCVEQGLFRSLTRAGHGNQSRNNQKTMHRVEAG